jgi:type I restriction enzyme S subunit
VKVGWATKPLSALCDFQRGLTYAKGDEVAVSSNVVLRANNIDLASGRLDFTDLRYISDTIDIPPSKLVRRDSLIICTASGSKSHLGKVAYIDDDYGYAFGGFMGLVSTRPELDARFLFYLMISPAYTAFTHSLGDGVNINNLKFNVLGTFSVPVPPRPEQRRIVAILDEACEGIATAAANAEKNLQNAWEVFQSERDDALSARPGWNEGALGDLCEIKHGFAFQGEFFKDSGEFVLLTPGNFFEHGGYRDRGEKQKYYVGEFPDAYLLKRGDMLVAMTEQAAGLLGSPLIVPTSGTFLHNQRLGLVVPREGCPWVTDYFFHVFNTARVRKEIHDSGTGQKVRHTAPSRIQAVRVTYPPTATGQQDVAARLAELNENTERLEAIYQRKIDALDELKKSLLHQAFTGAL